MGKWDTKSAKHAKPLSAEYEFARAVASEPAKPITKRRIVLAACCGTALLAALATMPARNATTATQVAATKPAPAIRTTHPTAEAWTQVRPEDVTGAIAKKKKSSKTKYMKAAEENDALGGFFKNLFGDDKTATRRRTSAID